MSSSIRKTQFLLDENVRGELFPFLENLGFSPKIAPKGSSDETLAKISIKEKRVLVTNDEDFSEYPKSAIFSVIWLRIPQNDPQSLIKMFNLLLKECKDFKGKLIVLEKNIWKAVPLPTVQSMQPHDEGLGKK